MNRKSLGIAKVVLGVCSISCGVLGLWGSMALCGENVNESQDASPGSSNRVFADQPIRMWSDRTGSRQVEARLLSCSADAHRASFSRPGSDRTICVEVDALSTADQEYLRDLLKTQTGDAPKNLGLALRTVAIKQVAPPAPGPAGDSIETIVAGLKNSQEAIVAYAPAKLPQARAKCEALGLKLKYVYGLGEFLVCRWPEGTDLKATLAELNADPSIRFVEPNWTISLDPPQPAKAPVQNPVMPLPAPAQGAMIPNQAVAEPAAPLRGESIPGLIQLAGWRHHLESFPCYPVIPCYSPDERRPNDPYYPWLWGMEAIKAPRAWACRQRSHLVVAVIDTGFDYHHEDLGENVWHNPWEIPDDNIDNDGNGVVDDVVGFNAIQGTGDPDDDNGHGTHVSGTIGAVGNNGIGVAGVNWRVKIMGVKFLGPNGAGNDADAVKAIDYAWRNGARIINASWSSPAPNQIVYQAIARAEAAGVLFVAAAGNNGSDNDIAPRYPASFADPEYPYGKLSNVVSVAAIKYGNDVASFSNYGKRSVLIAAPGQDILSTVPPSQGKYKYDSGTSMATPHVAGAFALVWSDPKYASFSLKDIKGLVLSRSQRRLRLYDKIATGGTLDLRFLCPEGTPCPVPAGSCDFSCK